MGSKKEQFTYVSNTETLQRMTGHFSSSTAQVHCLSLLDGVCAQGISACFVLFEQTIVQVELDMLSIQIAFHLLQEHKEFESEGNVLVIRLIHTVRNIHYFLSLIAAISIIIHKSFERGGENSPGFVHRPHWEAIQLTIHFHQGILCLRRIVSGAVLLSL